MLVNDEQYCPLNIVELSKALIVGFHIVKSTGFFVKPKSFVRVQFAYTNDGIEKSISPLYDSPNFTNFQIKSFDF